MGNGLAQDRPSAAGSGALHLSPSEPGKPAFNSLGASAAGQSNGSIPLAHSAPTVHLPSAGGGASGQLASGNRR